MVKPIRDRFEPVTESLALLDAPDRRRLWLVALAQMSTSFLDLLGVALIGLTTALAVSISTNSTPPPFIASAFDRLGLANVSLTTIVVICALTAALVLVLKSIASFGINRRIMLFLATRTAKVSARLTAELLERPLLEIQRRTSQQTAYALTVGVNSAILQILSQTVIVLSESVLLLLLCIGLVLVSPGIALFSMAFFAMVFWLIHKMLSQWAQRLGQELSIADVGSTIAIQEALLTYRESYVGGRRQAQVKRIQGLRWDSAMSSAKIQVIGIAPKYALEVALVVGGAALAASQFMTRGVAEAMGLIVLFLAAASRIVPSLLRLQAASLGIRQSRGAAVFACELDTDLRGSSHYEGPKAFDQDVESKPHRWVDHDGFEPSIDLHDVRFTYPGASKPAAFDITLDVAPGQSCALVGATGSGKSTLADLILGVLRPDSGTARISSESPDRAVHLWPGAIAYVPQEVGLIGGSVRANVALGLPVDAFSDSDIWRALEQARLDVFLRELRDGLDTEVGESGVNLSGGQRQRLGIARALLTRPKLVVLDEATSALDASTEREISRTIEDLHGSVTLLVVAHRLATVRNFDSICFLRDGHVDAVGNFDDVRRTSIEFDEHARLLGL